MKIMMTETAEEPEAMQIEKDATLIELEAYLGIQRPTQSLEGRPNEFLVRE